MSTKSKLALVSATLVTLFTSSAFAQTVNSPASQQGRRVPLGSGRRGLRHRHRRARRHPGSGPRHRSGAGRHLA